MPPPIFGLLQQIGKVGSEEMFRVFNMGVGYVLIVAPSFTRSIMAALRRSGETVYFLGKVKRGSGRVSFK